MHVHEYNDDSKIMYIVYYKYLYNITEGGELYIEHI